MSRDINRDYLSYVVSPASHTIDAAVRGAMVRLMVLLLEGSLAA